MTQPDAAQAFESYSKRFRRRALRRNLSDWLMFLAGAGLILWGILAGAAAMHYNWQWYRVPQFFFRRIDGELIAGPLVRGLGVTLEVTLAAAPLALGIGLVVALLRLSRSFSGRALSTVYLEAIRNTPLLVQMYLFYFVLSPILGIERFWTGVLCLAVFEASFISEIIRGGILSVRRGQWEAASALGLGKRVTYARVVLPQAVPLMLPPLDRNDQAARQAAGRLRQLRALGHARQAGPVGRLRDRRRDQAGQGHGRAGRPDAHRLGRHHPGADRRQVRRDHRRHVDHARAQPDQIDFTSPYSHVRWG
jgi:polar amino acid transport system permease protein